MSAWRSVRATALALSAVVILSTYVPEVLVQGLVAILFLRVERSGVGSDSPQVLAACLYSSADSAKALTCQRLVGGDGCRTRYCAQSADLQVTALGVSGRCYTVRAQNHLLVGCVSGLLVNLSQSA